MHTKIWKAAVVFALATCVTDPAIAATNPIAAPFWEGIKNFDGKPTLDSYNMDLRCLSFYTVVGMLPNPPKDTSANKAAIIGFLNKDADYLRKTDAQKQADVRSVLGDYIDMVTSKEIEVNKVLAADAFQCTTYVGFRKGAAK